MRWIVGAAVLAALAVSAPSFAQAPEAPAVEAVDSQAVIRKLNPYVGLLNRTLRASQSLSRYYSWVDPKTGPTGRERIVYGLYSLYDVRGEIEKAKEATGFEPKMPELDTQILAYIDAYQALAPVITKADGYYERQDYKDDKMARGKELHEALAPAGKAYLEAREKVDALLSLEKDKSDAAELAAIEQAEGRKARWHVAHVMMKAKAVVDILPTEDKPVVDMKLFEERLSTYAAAVRDMDDFAAENPNSFFVFESQPRSLLGRLRDFRDKVAKVKGDARKNGANDLTWIVNTYNMMVSSAESATTFNR